MISALFGLASALSLGGADFMARFSARALGAPLTYAFVLLVGALGTSVWFFASGAELVWSPLGNGFAVAHGVFVAVMCILLYTALARGPIAVVAPIVAAHPALVLLVNVLLGVRPSALQWAAMMAILVGGITIARGATSEPDRLDAERNRVTVLIAITAAVAYAGIFLTAQVATPLIGALQTLLVGRCVGLVFIALMLLLQGVRPRVPAAWLPFVSLQAGLDAAGYFTLLAGAKSAEPHITLVVASGFSVVTVVLARIVINESVGKTQWAAIGLIAAGTALLLTAA
jgi:drug/metabolite transporter (DMT)-like permease